MLSLLWFPSAIAMSPMTLLPNEYFNAVTLNFTKNDTCDVPLVVDEFLCALTASYSEKNFGHDLWINQGGVHASKFENIPKGCYVKNNSYENISIIDGNASLASAWVYEYHVWYNEQDQEGSNHCSELRACKCKGEEELRTSGNCAEVLTAQECMVWGNDTYVPEEGAKFVMDTTYRSTAPHGCSYVAGKGFQYNGNEDSVVDCSSTQSCVCSFVPFETDVTTDVTPDVTETPDLPLFDEERPSERNVGPVARGIRKIGFVMFLLVLSVALAAFALYCYKMKKQKKGIQEVPQQDLETSTRYSEHENSTNIMTCVTGVPIVKAESGLARE